MILTHYGRMTQWQHCFI